MGGERRTRWLRLRNAFDATDEGGPDPQKDRQLVRRPTLVGAHEVGEHGSYLGIEVDDALGISEQVEL